jgi:hypothetical protein
MPSNQLTNRIRSEVADIADQLAHLYEHWERILQDDIEHRLDIP